MSVSKVSDLASNLGQTKKNCVYDNPAQRNFPGET